MGANRIYGLATNPRYTTPYQREMLYHYLHFNSYGGVAYQMGVSIGTVKRGLERLRAHCGAKTNHDAALELNMAVPGWMTQVPKGPIMGYRESAGRINPIWHDNDRS